MLHLVAILLPPAAVLACGKPIQAIFINVPLTICFWIPGVIHAFAVVSAFRTRSAGVNMSQVVNVNMPGDYSDRERRRLRQR
ncbi:MAG: YqaE/Pmp3 family membrane protein [Planctomycetes bacterium]|nr:YqaE/Pmp3 family membrane protein [Planctomycetota bacterium]